MDLDMTIRAVRVLRVLVMLRASRFFRADTVRHAMACQTELTDAARNQQARIGRTVWCVTGDAPFSLNRSMFVNKRTLLVYVTLEASRIDARCEARLFKFKPSVRIVAVAALHRPFQHLVMEWQLKLVFGLAMAAQAELGFTGPEQFHACDARFLRVC